MVPTLVFSESVEGVDWRALKAALAADNFDNGRTPEEYEASHRGSYGVVFATDGNTYVGNARILSDGGRILAQPASSPVSRQWRSGDDVVQAAGISIASTTWSVEGHGPLGQLASTAQRVVVRNRQLEAIDWVPRLDRSSPAPASPVVSPRRGPRTPRASSGRTPRSPAWRGPDPSTP